MADVFRGSSIASVEDSGRFKVPVIFQKLIEKQLGEGAEFFITSMDGKRARLYPIKEWEAKEAILATLPESDPDREFFQNMTSYYGAPAAMDKAGRLQIPPVLRAKANLKGEVVVLGKAGKEQPGFLEVVNHEQFQTEMEEAAKLADKAGRSRIGL
jgi:MraZ protein